MCPGDQNGYIPVKYFKEVKYILMGKQIDYKNKYYIIRHENGQKIESTGARLHADACHRHDGCRNILCRILQYY